MLIHVIDFEGSLKCGVVEYGVASLEDCNIVDVRTGLCKPEQSMDPRDIQVHGLRDVMLADKPSFALEQSLFYELRKGGVLAAHHASVENGFLQRYWTVVPSEVSHGHIAPGAGSWGPWIDSRVLYQHFYDLDTYSLTRLVELFQLTDELSAVAEQLCPENRRKPHCALYDAIASALLIIRVQKEFGLSDSDLIRISQPSGSDDFSQTELL